MALSARQAAEIQRRLASVAEQRAKEAAKPPAAPPKATRVSATVKMPSRVKQRRP